MIEIDILLIAAELLAKNTNDGHLTIMRFTTGWKAFIGTPDLDSGDGRGQLEGMEGFPELEDALKNLLRNKVTVNF